MESQFFQWSEKGGLGPLPAQDVASGEHMNSNLINTSDYKTFIQDVKQRIQASQIKAATSVNRELLLLYWDLAERIVARQQASNWGDNFLEQLSRDLQADFPEMKGFSKRNLELMRQWYQFWSATPLIAKQVASQPDQPAIAQQLVAQIPWGHFNNASIFLFLCLNS